MAADANHARIVELLGDTHEQRLLNILTQLEERIASLINNAPVEEGNLADLNYAIEARQGIRQAFRETYTTEVDAIVRDYDKVIDSMREMWDEYGQTFAVPEEVVTNLKTLTFQGFEDIGSTFADELAQEVYQNTLTGRSREDAVRNIRQRINGVYMTSDKSEVNRLVALAQDGDEEAVEKLHRVYATDRTGRNMRRYAKQMVHDALSQFDASLAVTAGKEIDAEKWKYFGSLVEDSRPICQRLIAGDLSGKYYTEEQIRTLWDTENWAGKAAGDPFIVRGGYNCRHLWRPAFEDLD